MPPKVPLTADRRLNPRYPVRPTEYIEIGDNNGGIVLDISESGMAVASAQALVGNQTLRFRFQLPRSLKTIETLGEINWIGETKKRAGVRFVDLSLSARDQIQEWIRLQVSGEADIRQKPHTSAVPAAPKYPRAFTHQETSATNGGILSPVAMPSASPFVGPLDEPEEEDSEDSALPHDGKHTEELKNPPPERRVQSRLLMTASTYVQLNDDNGGLMADLSTTGFCVRAAKTLETDELPLVRFQIPDSEDFIESPAWIVWKSASKKTAGIRFNNLSDEAKSQIAKWIDSQAPSKDSDRRQQILSAQKEPTPVKLMAPDSVPVPGYISSPVRKPAASPNSTSTQKLDAPPSPRPSNSPSVPLAVVPPLHKPSLPAAAAKSTAGVTATPAVPVAATSVAPVLPRLQKSLAQAPAATPSRNIASGLPLPAAPSSDISRDSKNLRDERTASPTSSAASVPVIPAPPSSYTDPWALAPKRSSGPWKIAAIGVVVLATLLGGTMLLRKKSAEPASQETAQNSAIAAGVPAANTSPEPASAPSDSNGKPTPSSTSATPVDASPHTSAASHENVSTAKSEFKSDAEFVDQPRPSSSQAQLSRPAATTAQPIPRPVRNTVPLTTNVGAPNVPADRNSTSVIPVRPPQNNPASDSSNENDAATSRASMNSPASAPAQVQPHSQEANAPPPSSPNLSQNASSTTQPVAPPQNISSSAASPSAATTPAFTSASQSPTPAQNLVGSVSVYSRFRAIRNSDSAHPAGAGAELQIGRVISSPAPVYPSEAQHQQIQGTVELQILVGTNGSVQSVHLVKGPPELAEAAMTAVRSWRYGPTMLGGHPVETDQSIYFAFKLGK